MIKKIGSIVLFLCILCIFCIACADFVLSDPCEIPSLGCSISCPVNWVSYYVGMPEEILSRLCISMDLVKKTLNEFSAELIAMNTVGEYEMMVFKSKALLDIALAEKSEAFLQGFIVTFISGTETDQGIVISDSAIVRKEDNVYIWYIWSIDDKEGSDKYINYYTASDGYSFDFVFFCGPSVTDKMKMNADSIMSSVIWDKLM